MMGPWKKIARMTARPVLGALLITAVLANPPLRSIICSDRPLARGPQTMAKLSAAHASWPIGPLAEPFYGMHFVPTVDLQTVKGLGTEVVLMSFRYGDTPEDWRAYLEAADSEDIRVIAWLWPEGWSWDEEASAWEIDARAELFLETVSGHPAIFAVYALHEPYWNGCWGCGYTTTQQQALYSAIKAIADVPIHSAVDSMSAWTQYAEEYSLDTAFADGICDYCETWYHPFREDGTYERATLISHVEADLAVAKERAPNSKIIWSMQSFAQEGYSRMPTAAEMRDLALIVYTRGVDGALWYPWSFRGDLYSDSLSNHEELYPVVKEIYDEVVTFPYRIHLPLVLFRDLSVMPSPTSVEQAQRSPNAVPSEARPA